MSDSKLDTDNIYEILKNRIIHLEYEPGQVLNEVDVAEEFNISRTPIRRVFQLLHGDKLLILFLDSVLKLLLLILSR